MTSDAAKDTAVPDTTSGSLTAGAERIRESAKWLIVAFAAVGTVLVAGLQLTSLGELERDRLAWAIGGLSLAAGGVVVAIIAAGGVVTASFVSMKWLSEQAGTNVALDGVEGDTGLLGGYQTVDELKKAYDESIKARREALKDSYDEPANESKRIKAEAAQAWVRTLDQSQVHVIERASFNKLRNAYKDAGKRIAAGAVLATAGIAAFAWGANPPPSESTALVIPSPTEVVVQIDKEDRAGLQSTLGTGCDLGNLHGVAVDVVGESYKIATVATEECNASLITVTPDIGRVTTPSASSDSVVKPADPGSGHGA